MNIRKDRIYFGVIALLIMLQVGLGAIAYQFRQRAIKAEAALVKEREDWRAESMAADTSHAEAIRELTGHWEAEIARQEVAWKEEVSRSEKEHQERLAAAYDRFDELVSNSGGTIDYFIALEARLKQGQELSDQEVSDLTVLATGMQFLRDQYTKPLEEFAALGNYFEGKAQEEIAAPEKRFGFVRRIFSRGYRENQREYQDQITAQDAYREAADKFNQAYGQAQASMARSASEFDAHLGTLRTLIDSKERSWEDVADFVEQSKDMLRVHEQILNYEPEPEEAPHARPVPLQ